MHFTSLHLFTLNSHFLTLFLLIIIMIIIIIEFFIIFVLHDSHKANYRDSTQT